MAEREKTVVVDLYGTLVNESGTIKNYALPLLETIKELGVTIVLLSLEDEYELIMRDIPTSWLPYFKHVYGGVFIPLQVREHLPFKDITGLGDGLIDDNANNRGYVKAKGFFAINPGNLDNQEEHIRVLNELKKSLAG